MNLYGYTQNDPVNFIDPNGLEDKTNKVIVTGPSGWRRIQQMLAMLNSIELQRQQRMTQDLVAAGARDAAGAVRDPPDDCPDGTSADTSRPPDYTGLASSYGRNRDGTPDQFAGQPTRSGDIMDPNAFTAASVRLRDSQGRVTTQQLIPNRSYVFVTSPSAPGRGATVYVNDTGPLRAGRIIDLSSAAMQHLTGNIVDLIPVKVYMCRPNN